VLEKAKFTGELGRTRRKTGEKICVNLRNLRIARLFAVEPNLRHLRNLRFPMFFAVQSGDGTRIERIRAEFVACIRVIRVP
jgi:hypothetical protein